MRNESALVYTVLLITALTMSSCMSTSAPTETPMTATLVDTSWRLTLLGNEVIDNPPGERAVQFALQSKNLLVTGFAGCNRLMGRYVLAGDRLKFDQLGGTKMFCDGRMELEGKFLGALAQVARWRINGATLELLDADGRTIGTFAAQELPAPQPN